MTAENIIIFHLVKYWWDHSAISCLKSEVVIISVSTLPQHQPSQGEERRGISPDIISCHINPGQGTVIVTFSLLSSHFQGNVGP